MTSESSSSPSKAGMHDVREWLIQWQMLLIKEQALIGISRQMILF